MRKLSRFGHVAMDSATQKRRWQDAGHTTMHDRARCSRSNIPCNATIVTIIQRCALRNNLKERLATRSLNQPIRSRHVLTINSLAQFPKGHADAARDHTPLFAIDLMLRPGTKLRRGRTRTRPVSMRSHVLEQRLKSREHTSQRVYHLRLPRGPSRLHSITLPPHRLVGSA